MPLLRRASVSLRHEVCRQSDSSLHSNEINGEGIVDGCGWPSRGQHMEWVSRQICFAGRAPCGGPARLTPFGLVPCRSNIPAQYIDWSKNARLALWPPGTQEVACRLPGLTACTMVDPEKGQINPQLSCRISGDCPGHKRQQHRQHGISTAFSVLVHENGLTGGVDKPCDLSFDSPPWAPRRKPAATWTGHEKDGTSFC